MTLKVSTVQFQHRANDKAYNLGRIDAFVAEAATAGIELVVFPEMCITGYWHVPKLDRAGLDGARLDDRRPDRRALLRHRLARRDGFTRRHRLAGQRGLALDERLARQLPISPTDAVVAGKVNLPSLIDNILQLLPETETIAVVIGASELERFWRDELRREFGLKEQTLRREELQKVYEQASFQDTD